MTGPITRRDLLEKATAATAAATLTIVPRHVLGGAGHIAPSEKMNIAGVGLGDMGPANLRNLESENIVALCDVDPNYAARPSSVTPARSSTPTIARCSTGRRTSTAW